MRFEDGELRRRTIVRLALKTLGIGAVSLEASPLAEMMVTVGLDMVGVGVELLLLVPVVEVEAIRNFLVCVAKTFSST